MPEIIVSIDNTITSIPTIKGERLFNALRRKGFSIYAPCGGTGSCGKCLVFVKGTGMVNSCMYTVQESIEVILPEPGVTEILRTQHALTRDLPLNPGESVLLSDNPHGVAIDLGTTTLVFYVINLKTGSLVKTITMLNPQHVFGSDVISRIQYSSRGPYYLKELNTSICKAINLQFSGLKSIINVNDIVKITIAGNNTMLHILAGESPSSMGQSPYVPVFTNTQIRTPFELGLHCHPKARISLMPSVSAFIGADIIAGIASIQPTDLYRHYIFMDLGTNGELALVTPDTIWCCATAAGPAFEGASISCGMGGVEGAISHYSESGFKVIGHQKPVGLCGSGLVDVVAYLIEQGLLDASGLLKEDYEIVTCDQSGTGKAITITQQDIREVQLAKSAIASGINILLKQANLKIKDLDAVFLAGGFGNYMNVDSAMRIGLIPAQMKDKIVLLGNTAGSGAVLFLKCESFDTIITDEILKLTKHIELSEDDCFALEFVMNMNFEPKK